VRRLSPPDTLGGGTILDAAARRHGRRPEVLARLRARAQGRPDPRPEPIAAVAEVTPAPPPDPAAVARLEAELLAAGVSLLGEGALDPTALAVLRADGRAVRVSGRLYAHVDVAAQARATIVALIENAGPASLAEVRDALGTGRKPAQALLEYLDSERVTLRGPDDRRVLRGRAAARP
jgi:selenocysteine-specific elongation factor